MVTSVHDAQRIVDSLVASRAPARELGAAYKQLGDALDVADVHQLASEAYLRSIALARQAADSLVLADAQYGLGLLHWRRNRYDTALTYLRPALALREQGNDRAAMGRVLNTIGACFYQLGQYEYALNAFVRSLALRREAHDSAGMARILTNIGKTYQDWRQYRRARQVLDEAVAIASRVDNPAVLGYALNSLAMLYVDMGEFTPVRPLLMKSRAAYSAGRAHVTLADSLSGWSLNTLTMGILLTREGRAADALLVLDSVLAAGEQRGSVRGQARALLYLGEAYRRLQRPARAKTALTESLRLSRSVEQRVMALDALEALADVEEAGGRPGDALRHLRAFQLLRDTIFDQSTAQHLATLEASAEAERQQDENERLREKQRVHTLIIQRQRAVGALGAVIVVLSASLLLLSVYFIRRGRARERALARANSDLAEANKDLRHALSEVNTLSGLIPICASCKSVRDDRGYWESVETYIANRSDATFTHGICQSCGPRLYGDFWAEEPSAPLAAASHVRRADAPDSHAGATAGEIIGAGAGSAHGTARA